MSQHQFFTVAHGLKIEVVLLDDGATLPDYGQFESEIPEEFKISCEFSHLDGRNEQAAVDLAKHDLESVNQLIQAQNLKINILLNFLLSQQSKPENSIFTTHFGAGELSYQSNTAIGVGQLAQINLHLEQPSAAVYCYAQCVECIQQDDHYQARFEYVLIREDDRDLLIRAALNQQQKLLRQRSLNRDS